MLTLNCIDDENALYQDPQLELDFYVRHNIPEDEILEKYSQEEYEAAKRRVAREIRSNGREYMIRCESELGRLIEIYQKLTEEEQSRLSERMKKLIAEAQEK